MCIKSNLLIQIAIQGSLLCIAAQFMVSCLINASLCASVCAGRSGIDCFLHCSNSCIMCCMVHNPSANTTIDPGLICQFLQYAVSAYPLSLIFLSSHLQNHTLLVSVRNLWRLVGKRALSSSGLLLNYAVQLFKGQTMGFLFCHNSCWGMKSRIR